MEPVSIKPLQYGNETAVKANIHGQLFYRPQNGDLLGQVALFGEDDKAIHFMNFTLGKDFTDTWEDDSNILPAALSKLEIETA